MNNYVSLNGEVANWRDLFVFYFLVSLFLTKRIKQFIGSMMNATKAFFPSMFFKRNLFGWIFVYVSFVSFFINRIVFIRVLLVIDKLLNYTHVLCLTDSSFTAYTISQFYIRWEINKKILSTETFTYEFLIVTRKKTFLKDVYSMFLTMIITMTFWIMNDLL